MFTAHGYHAASMKSIAAKVGISGPALYRHYPSKYDMFAAAVFELSQHVVDCTDFVDAISDSELTADPDAVLSRVIDALVEETLANRESGGLYRWQARYLNAEDLAALLSQLRVVNRRIQRPLSMVRPSLASPQRSLERWILSSGLLSVIGSIVDHRTQLPADQMRALLADAVSAMLAARLPEPGDEIAVCAPARQIPSPDADPREVLLDTAMVLFGDHGYSETTMMQIAEGSGVPVSGIYRYFPGKYEILAAGLRRGLERLTGELSAAADTPGEPSQVLNRVIETFVTESHVHPELALVYYTERVNLEPADEAFLRNVLRKALEYCAPPLVSVRSDLDARQARVLMHGAMALALDLGWLVGYDRFIRKPKPFDNPAYLRACVRKLIDCTLLGSALDQRMW